jgi:hypothetical protein
MSTVPRRFARALAFCAIPAVTAFAATARPAAAQVEVADRPPASGRGSFGIALQVSEPKGAFADNVGNGFGAGVHGLFRLDPDGIINWRADIGMLVYGNSRRRISFPGTGGLIRLDLRTSNNIANFVTGPQLLGSTGRVTPYAAALGGFSVFWTSSTLEVSNNQNEPFAETTNASDAVLAYGGAVGLYARVHEGRNPVRLDVGARFLRHDDVRYLNADRVREAYEQDRPPTLLRGRADFVTYYLGVNIWGF